MGLITNELDNKINYEKKHCLILLAFFICITNQYFVHGMLIKCLIVDAIAKMTLMQNIQTDYSHLEF